MSYIVVLAPNLGVTPEEFTSEWNADPSTPQTAQVLTEQPKTQYINPTLIHKSIELLGDLSGTAAIGAIVKLLETKFHKNRRTGNSKAFSGKRSLKILLQKRN